MDFDFSFFVILSNAYKVDNIVRLMLPDPIIPMYTFGQLVDNKFDVYDLPEMLKRRDLGVLKRFLSQ